MRCLVYFDLPDTTDTDRSYKAHLAQELPGRLKLLDRSYDLPWTVTFADELYGDDTFTRFISSVHHYRDEYDVVILMPHPDRVEQAKRVEIGEQVKDPYFRLIQDLVLSAKNIPVIAYVDTPGPRVEFNMLVTGVAAVVDYAAEPALLPLKIINAISESSGTHDHILRLGPAEINVASGVVTIKGHAVDLTSSERSLMRSLARFKGQLRTKEQLLSAMYSIQDEEPDIKIVDVFMTKLRSKLNSALPGFGFDLLRTTWGDGYSVVPEMPEGRLHRGLLRLDPQPHGGFVIADTQIQLTAGQVEMFDTLYQSLHTGSSTASNYMKANWEVLESLAQQLASYLVSKGEPVHFDPENEKVFLNPEYFDADIFEASTFNSLLRQEIKIVGPYQLLRESTGKFLLGDTGIGLSLAEVRLLEHVVAVEGQALRAGSVARQVRGESHYLRGQVTPEEDILNLARSLYTKLHQLNTADDPKREIYIYHNAYVSFGPADNVPDPEDINAEHRDNVQSLLRSRLERSTGTPVELKKYDAGLFTLKVHPALGNGMIEGKNAELSALQVTILMAVHRARPGILSQNDLFEQAFPTREFSQQRLSTETYNLRRLLASFNPEWAGALTLVRGKRQGYIWLNPGEKTPEERLKDKQAGQILSARIARSTAVDADALTMGELTDIPLTGGLVLMYEAKTGRSLVKDTECVLSSSETKLMIMTAERYPATVFSPEVLEKLQIKALYALFDHLKEKWEAYCPHMRLPIAAGKGMRSFTWTMEPHALAENKKADKGANGHICDQFAFSAVQNGLSRSETLDVEFTVREMELLSLLEKERGQVLNFKAIRQESRLTWTDAMVLSTLENAVGKVARSDRAFAALIKFSKQHRSMQLMRPAAPAIAAQKSA